MKFLSWSWKQVSNRCSPVTANSFPMNSFFFKNDQKKLRSSKWRCSIKKLFLKISQNSQENTCARVSFLSKKRFWQGVLLILTYSINHSLTLKITHWKILSLAHSHINSHTLPFLSKTFCWCNIDNNISSIMQEFYSAMFLHNTFSKYILYMLSYFKLSHGSLDWCYE